VTDARDIPSGWYPDTERGSGLRYWSGTEWTGFREPASASSAQATTARRSNAPLIVIAGIGAAAVVLAVGVVAGVGIGSLDADETSLRSDATTIEDEVVQPLARHRGDSLATRAPVPAPTAAVEEPLAEPADEADGPYYFRTQALGNLDDFGKDLDDMVITVGEEGFWRLLSNSLELNFNLGQLQALTAPDSIRSSWDVEVTALSTGIDDLDAAITEEDAAAILVRIEELRTHAAALDALAQQVG
jgi:hypothetical protein